MKFGETFSSESVPGWAPYNVDYNDLKYLIKVNTTRNQGQAIAIPGQEDTAFAKFEDSFFNELYNQHDRVDLFVKSKADEISRRLQFLEKEVLRLLARSTYTNSKPMSQARKRKFAKFDVQIVKCGEDTKLLERFIDLQRMAFRKILKKYTKWTASRALSEKFNTEVLKAPKSFLNYPLDPILSRHNNLLKTLRTAVPDSSLPSSPSTTSRRPSAQLPAQPTQQAYWNEYDDGSEAENEPYTIYVDPDADVTFPGSKAITHIILSVKAPMEKIKDWLSLTPTPGDQRPLLTTENGTGNGNGNPLGYFTETDVDDDVYASSSDFPTGYAAHYATFPSVKDQALRRTRDQLLFWATVISYMAALGFFLVAGMLVATGKHKLRVEVDVGAIVGIVFSFLSATLGFGLMLYREQELTWLHKGIVSVAFIGICLLNGMLLILVVGNSGV